MPILQAAEIGLDESGITEYSPSCKNSNFPICIEKIEVDKDKMVFINVFADIDSLPDVSFDTTSEKMEYSSRLMKLLLAMYNPGIKEINGGDYEPLSLNLKGYKAENIVILLKAVSKKNYYTGFSTLEEGEEMSSVITGPQIPIDYYYSQKKERKDTIKSIKDRRLPAEEIGLDESGITEYSPSCKNSNVPICIEKIEVGKDKMVFINVFADIDSLPDVSLDTTDEKMTFSVGLMELFLAAYNPKVKEIKGGDYEPLSLNLKGYKAENIVILLRAVSNKSYYVGYATLEEDNEMTGITIGNEEPIDYYYSKGKDRKDRIKRIKDRQQSEN